MGETHLIFCSDLTDIGIEVRLTVYLFNPRASLRLNTSVVPFHGAARMIAELVSPTNIRGLFGKGNVQEGRRPVVLSR